MSKLIRLKPATWTALALVVGVSPETMTPAQARQAIDELLMNAVHRAAPQLPATTYRPAGDQLLDELRAQQDPEGWLQLQHKPQLRAMVRRIGHTRETNTEGRYYRKEELRAILLSWLSLRVEEPADHE